MPAVKDRGFLLQKIPFSETSLILKVFTETGGLISLMAKGAKRPQSRSRGHLDFFSELDLVYYRNPRSELWNLGEVSTLRAFSELKTNPRKQVLGQVMAEVYLRYGHGSAEPQGFYQLLAKAWAELDKETSSGEEQNSFAVDSAGRNATRSQPGSPLLSRFLLEVCRLSGFGPEFEYCLHCGAAVETSAPVRFRWSDGAAICHSCTDPEGREGGLVRLRGPLVDALRNGSKGKVTRPPLSMRETMAAETFLLQYLGRHSGGEKPLKAWEVWQEMSDAGTGLA